MHYSACMKEPYYACSQQKEARCPYKAEPYDEIHKVSVSKTHDGYVDEIRIQQDFIFYILETMPSDKTAPLLCAETTVFHSMLQHGFKKGDKGGAFGIDKLVHLVIQFANKLECEVYAISSLAKMEGTIEFGAKHYINYKDTEENNKVLKDKLNYIIITSSIIPINLNESIHWMSFNSKIILLSIPE
ncbi:hypothetical protein K502DRAFT_326330 [Neoconidiobolus thromboides FSU 785]|nr:hypothetical protein K502DRAFT_326330 [Neoconidiobolus thromboides FSU 785]